MRSLLGERRCASRDAISFFASPTRCRTQGSEFATNFGRRTSRRGDTSGPLLFECQTFSSEQFLGTCKFGNQRREPFGLGFNLGKFRGQSSRFRLKRGNNTLID